MEDINILKGLGRNAKVGTQKMPTQNTKKLNVDIEDKDAKELQQEVDYINNLLIEWRSI